MLSDGAKAVDLSCESMLPDYLVYALNNTRVTIDSISCLANATRKVTVQMLRRFDQSQSNRNETHLNQSQDEDHDHSDTASSPLVIADLVDLASGRPEDSEDTKSNNDFSSGYINAADYNKKIQFQNLKCVNGKIKLKIKKI